MTGIIGRRARVNKVNIEGEIVWLFSPGGGSTSALLVLLLDSGSMVVYYVADVTVIAKQGEPYR